MRPLNRSGSCGSPRNGCAAIHRSDCSCLTRHRYCRPAGVCDFALPALRPGQPPLAFWRAEADPTVVRAHAVRVARGAANALDLYALNLPVTVFREAGIEYVLICDGPRRLRLELTGDSVIEGPIDLRYDLSGFSGLAAGATALHRLGALWRLRRLPRTLFPSDGVARRLADALRAWDAERAGASQRDIAGSIFGSHMLRPTRHQPDPLTTLRKRIVRLVGKAGRAVMENRRRFLGG